MLTMGAAGREIDLLTVKDELDREGHLELAGGIAGLALLEEQASIRAHLGSYLTIVREKSVLRDLAAAGASLSLHAMNGAGDPQPIIEEVRTVLEHLALRAIAKERRFKPLTAAELVALEIADPTFLLSTWLPAASINYLVGDSEAYKSWFALYLAFCVAAGRPLFDTIHVVQAPVLVISEENGLAEDRRRVSAIARGMGFALEELPLHVVSDSMFSFDDAALYGEMRQFVTEHGIRLLIVDSLVRVHSREENNTQQMNALYRDRLKPLALEGLSLLALHHKRKLPSGLQANGTRHAGATDNDDIRGSGDIRASAHSILFLRTVSPTKVVVRHNKARGWRKQDPYVFSVRDVDSGGVELCYEGKPEQVLDKTEACRMELLEYAAARPGGFYRQDAVDAFKKRFSRKIVDAVLRLLSEKGTPLRMDEIRTGRSTKKFYTYVSPDPDVLEPGADDEPF